MHKNIFRPIIGTFSVLALSTGLALGQSQTNEMVRILKVEVSDSVKNQAAADGKAEQLTRVLSKLGENIGQGFTDTHKFTVLSVKLNDGGAERALTGNNELLGAGWLLATTVTGFKYDRKDIPNFKTGLVSAKCSVRLSGNAEFKKPNGLTINANFDAVANDLLGDINPNNNRATEMGDNMLQGTAQEAANQIVKKVMAEFKAEPPTSPSEASNTEKDKSAPKVVAVSLKDITIDWGNGMTISKGKSDAWDVLGATGKPAGKIIINFVDTGCPDAANAITPGCVLRKTQ